MYSEYAQNEMDLGREQSHFVLLKPIINIFAGEQFSAKYRQFLGDHQAFKKYKNLKEFIYAAIELFESLNPAPLDIRPPLDDPNVEIEKVNNGPENLETELKSSCEVKETQ